MLQKFKIIKNSSAYVKNVSLYLPAINRVISSEHLIDTIDRDEFLAFQVQPEKMNRLLHYWNGRIYMNIAFPSQSA